MAVRRPHRRQFSGKTGVSLSPCAVRKLLGKVAQSMPLQHHQPWQTSAIWPEVIDQNQCPGEVILQLSLSTGLFQFQGHFPNAPVLPGIAQLDWAVKFGRQYFDIERPVASVVRLKFHKLVRPNHNLCLGIAFKAGTNDLAFRYFDGEKRFSTGVVRFQAP